MSAEKSKPTPKKKLKKLRTSETLITGETPILQISRASPKKETFLKAKVTTKTKT
jgi:hypothetical protein